MFHFETHNRSQYGSFAELNQALLATIDRVKPDIMLVVQRDYEVWTETLDIVRSRGDVATVCWTTDDSWKYPQVSRFIGRHYDAMTTTYPNRVADYHRDGIPNVFLTQWGVSSDWLHAPLPATQCRHEVSFVGAAHGTRKERVAELRRHGIDVVCFGYGWPTGPVVMDDIPRIMRESVISLNLANSSGENQIKARTFEVPGAGGFLLTEEARGLKRWFDPGHEIETFANVKEAVHKIRYYLAHPGERDRVALAGYECARSEHTYERRMAHVLEFAVGTRCSVGAKLCSAGDDTLDDAIRRHALTPGLKLLRTALAGAGKLVWGATRGPRAARRLVFELSWRVAGEKTCSAAGWPGRMFPEQ